MLPHIVKCLLDSTVIKIMDVDSEVSRMIQLSIDISFDDPLETL
jgi:hypothetical protein